MELNFDKEIDALLRQTVKDKSASADKIPDFKHLDADEISAFAENALPETAKKYYTAHLADCDLCRKNLSNLISLNAEAESENIHAEEVVTIFPAIPWYRKLFAFPNLAYTLGALVVVFSGIIGFTILQNVNNSSVSEVSQSSERPNDTKEMSAEADDAPIEINSANTAGMNSNANAAVYSSNSMTANTSMNRTAMNSNTRTVLTEPAASPNAAPQDETRREDDLALSKDKEVVSPRSSVTAGSVSEQRLIEQKEAEKNAEAADAAKPAPASPTTTQPSVPDKQEKSDVLTSTRMRKNSLESKPETTSIGGKTFNRRNNVWYDAAYNGQSTTNLTRGTNEYKKLDQNLRVIVENLGGTVVVVWKEKAYRIQ